MCSTVLSFWEAEKAEEYGIGLRSANYTVKMTQKHS